MFIFSAENLAQTYRRLRYVREYATYQRLQGEEIQKKQQQIAAKQAELKQVKQAKENLLKEREAEKGKLEAQEKRNAPSSPICKRNSADCRTKYRANAARPTN